MKFTNIVEHFPEFLITRQPPDNFLEKDRLLYFEEDFKYKVGGVFSGTIRNVWIVNQLIIHQYRIEEAYSRHTHLPIKKKIRLYIKLIFFPTIKISKGLYIYNQWGSNYYHWVTEVLPLVSMMRNRLIEFPLILPEHYSRLAFVTQSLKILEVEPVFFSLKRPIHVGELMTLNRPIVAQCNPPLLIQMQQDIHARVKSASKPVKKVYISRSKAVRRSIVNEEDVIQELVGLGFDVVHMETKTFEEQVELMKQTAVLISCHGAGLANLLFMNHGCAVFELKASNNNFNCFFTLARLAGLRYFYQLCEYDSVDHRSSNIRVDIERMRIELKTILNVL